MSAPRKVRFPLGAAVRLAALDQDPYPILAELREHEPVSWVPETGMWFLTRRDDAVAVLKDAARFTTDAERSTIRDIFGAHMMTTDGEVALRHKRACLHAFRSDVLQREMAGWVGRRAGERVREVVEKPEFELMAEVATPLAVDSALYVLGLPAELAGRVSGWYDDFALALANFTGDAEVRARGKAAAAAFDQTVRPLLREASSGDRGLLAHLATTRKDRLSDEEIVANALIILFGGIETTASMIGNAVWSALATEWWTGLVEPVDEQERARRRAALIEEALRWQPAVQSITRHTTQDVEIRGVGIPSGSVVQCMIGGANRDPRHFEDPERFDPERPNASDHLSFGTGRHLCLGAHLARIEIAAVLAELCEHAPQLRFADAPAPAMRGYEFRRPETLVLRRAEAH